MKIQKKYQGAIPLNRIANEYNESEVNTYSTNYVNNLIVDNVVTEDSKQALSARQGKILNDKIKDKACVRYYTDEQLSEYTVSDLNLTEGLYRFVVAATGQGSAVLSMFLNGQTSLTRQLIEGKDGSIISTNNGGVNRIGTVDSATSLISGYIHVNAGYSRVNCYGGNANCINTCIFETQVTAPITYLIFNTTNSTRLYGLEFFIEKVY